MPALQNGTVQPFSLAPGVTPLQMLTSPVEFASFGPGQIAEANPVNGANITPKVSSLWYLFAVALVIVAFKFAVEHERSGMDFGFVGISVYNMIAVGSLAFLFLVVLKVVFNKWQVPGLSDLVNVV